MDMTHFGDTAVVAPWRYQADRLGALGYVNEWWCDGGLFVGGWAIGDDQDPAGPWRKGPAIQNGIDRVTPPVSGGPGIYIVTDADCVLDRFGLDDLKASVQAVRSGRYAWAVPHLQVVRHTAAGTEKILGGLDPRDDTDGNERHRGHPGGGLIVIARQVAEDRCLPDPRFGGWGQEDDSWAFALRTLYGEPWRGRALLHHLWHAPQQRMTRAVGSLEGQGLYRRYVGARLAEGPMRRLVAEGWRWWDDRLTARAEERAS